MNTVRKNIFFAIAAIAIFLITLSGCSSGPKINDIAQEMMDDPRLHENRSIVETQKRYTFSEDFFETNLSEPAGLTIVNGQIVVCDRAGNCLKIFSTDGKLIQEVGKTGNDELQFIAPCQVVYCNEKYYVLDSGNSRVQILNSDFSFSDEVELRRIDDFDSDSGYQDLAVDQEGNIYVTAYAITPQYTKVFKVTPNGRINEIGDHLIGYIEYMNDTLFFANYKTLYYAQEGFQEQTYVMTYENHLYKIVDDIMEVVSELPFGFNPSDFACDGDHIYLYSERFQTLDCFDLNGNYIETLYQFNGDVSIKYISYDETTDSLFATSPTEGKIYRISPQGET